MIMRSNNSAESSENVASSENVLINVIRISAALLVVAGHIRALLFVDWLDADHNIITVGFYGLTSIGHEAVVIFFLLSGYWVGGAARIQIRSGMFSWPGYVLARIIRLWVVLIPAIALTLVLDAIGRFAFGRNGAYSGDAAYSHVADPNSLDLGTILGNLFFLGGIRVSTLGSNGPLWSLSYEFWMYILGPLLLLAIRPGRLVFRLLYALLFIGLGLLVGFDVLRYLPIWLAGLAISALQFDFGPISVRRIKPRILTMMRLLAAAVTLTACVALHALSWLTGPVSDYVIAVCGSLLLVTMASGMGGLAENRGVLGWYARLAAFSYSVYAIHLPLLAFGVTLFGGEPWNRLRLSVATALIFLATVALALLAGWAFASATESRTSAVRTWAFRRLGLRRQRTKPPQAVDTGSPPVAR